MAVTENLYTGNGSATNYSFTFPYLETTDIKVSINGTLTTAYTLANPTTIQFTTAPANGAAIRIYRVTDDSALAATFYSGAAIRATDLNENFTQNLYVTQESSNSSASATTTANSALTASATATSTSNTALSQSATALTNSATAVSTANTASSNATTALSQSSAAVTTANSSQATATSAAADAASALSAATTASSNASTALSQSNTALSNSSTALSQSNTALSQSASAVSTANTANSNAAAALTAVANSVQYQLVANVAAIPGTPADGDAVEVANSTGIESFSPLANRPAGFVGDTGLSVRMQYTSSGSTWNWLNYFAIDSDTRYLKKSGGTLTGALTLNADPTQNLQAATKQYVDSVANAGGLPLTGGTMTGQILGDNSTSPTTPGYAFDGDANTGLYTTGADELALATGGSARLTIDAAGNVAVPGTLSQGGNNVLTTSSLSTSTSSTSTTTAATSSAVKTAYDLANTANTTATTANTTANAALPKTGGAMTGDLTLNAQSDLRFADADSSNWVALQGPATVSSNVTWTLPSADGTANQVLSTNGSGTLSWVTAAASGATVTTSDTAPSTPVDGDLWYDSVGGRLYVYYQDPNGSQWVDAAPQGGGSSTPTKIEVGNTKAEVTDTGSNGTFAVTTEGTQRLTVDSSGRVGIGTATPGDYYADKLVIDIGASAQDGLTIVSGSTANGMIAFADGTAGNAAYRGYLNYNHADDYLNFHTAAVERMRIDNNGDVGIGKTALSDNTNGVFVQSIGTIRVSRTNDLEAVFNRISTDGDIIHFRQDNTTEGTISVSGTTVSYNGAHLSRWSQLPGGAEREEILRGTVLSNLDEMCDWGEEDNEQLNRMQVSDVEGDPNVSGVFQAWDDDDDTYTDDFYCAMTGDFIIRIAEGVTVQRGDLLMSAGDGTAKPQDDDIIRSKTIAKVTSKHVTCTYDDGSYCVPCVLMAC